MQWHRTKLTLTRWDAHGYRITDTSELTGVPFTLETPGDEETELPFPTLDAAKAHADLLNQLRLTMEDNERLRAELDVQRGRWPPPLDDDDAAAAERFESIEQGDGRGVARPTIAQTA